MCAHMKSIDISEYVVVKAGVACQSETPIGLETLVALMERNESYIYWLQPHNSGVLAQIPAICINGKFYHPNLKLEKAIFRHVRLSRDFENQELLEDGTAKLRIPARLMQEKLKSSIRFQVRRVFVGVSCVPVSTTGRPPILKEHAAVQGMPLQKSARKTKRAVSRVVKKNSSAVVFDKTALLQLGRVCMAQHTQSLPATDNLSLALSPRALLSDLQNMFAAEFPDLAHRVSFDLAHTASPCI